MELNDQFTSEPISDEPVASDSVGIYPVQQSEPQTKKGSRRKKVDTVEMLVTGLDVSALYPDASPAFVVRLTGALHARGLVEPEDYFKPGAGDRFQSAMRAALKQDFLNAQALAKAALGRG